MKTGQYNDVSSFVDDMELMFNNAKTFYAGNQENADADLLQTEFSGELRRIVKEEDETCSPESKRLKLRISHGKVISSSTDDVITVCFTRSHNHTVYYYCRIARKDNSSLLSMFRRNLQRGRG